MIMNDVTRLNLENLIGVYNKNIDGANRSRNNADIAKASIELCLRHIGITIGMRVIIIDNNNAITNYGVKTDDILTVIDYDIFEKDIMVILKFWEYPFTIIRIPLDVLLKYLDKQDRDSF